MSERLIFGVHRDPGVVGERMARSKSGTPLANPQVAAFGPGPKGVTCNLCVHLRRVGGVEGRYYKCEMGRVSASTATDHRVGWPACSKYEPEEVQG